MGRIAVLASLLLLGGLVALAAKPPTAFACPACDEYIWKPPNAGGNGSSGGSDSSGAGGSSPVTPSARTSGSPSTGSYGGGGSPSTTGARTGIGTIAGTAAPEVVGALRGGAGTDSDRSGSALGGWESHIGDTGAGQGPATAGAGVLAASTNAAGGSPTGKLVLAAAALIGLVGLLAAWRGRRRRAVQRP